MTNFDSIKPGTLNLAEQQAAEIERLRDKLEIAYSEICFAVHDLAGERSYNYEMRSELLATTADEIRAFLDGTASTRPVPQSRSQKRRYAHQLQNTADDAIKYRPHRRESTADNGDR